MVQAVTLKRMGKVQNQFSKYTRNIPKAGMKGLYNLARFTQTVLKEEAHNAKINPWRRKLYPSIKAVPLSKSSWGVKMSKEGLYLDKMKTHAVALKRGRLITKWAKEKGRKGFIMKDGTRGIMVHPHPFTAKAITRVVKRAKGIVEKEVSKSIKKIAR